MRSVRTRLLRILFLKTKMRILLVSSLTAVLAAVSLSQVKTVPTPEVKTPFAESLQAVVVSTDGWDSSKGKARMFERSSPKAKWKATGKLIDVVIGRNGSAWAVESAPATAATFKKEGDGRSPAGLFPLEHAFGFASKPEQLKFPYTKIEETTECIDDAASTHYNEIVDRLRVGIFDWKRSEKMREFTPEYELGVFVAFNSYPVRRGDGSCIFLHIWKDATTPTSGCIAMARPDLERIVTWIDSKKNPYLVHLPIDTYNELRNGYGLPKLK